MRSGFSKRMIVAMAPLLIATLGGCVYSTEREKGAPVVMAPASGPVVMTQGPTQTAPAAVPVPADRVVYQEGRWQLYGDGRTAPYYWVWIPTGASLTGRRCRRLGRRPPLGSRTGSLTTRRGAGNSTATVETPSTTGSGFRRA